MKKEDSNKASLVSNEALEYNNANAESDGVKEEATDTNNNSANPGLNGVAAGLTNILCESFRGNFYENGGALNDRHRPGQLRELFAVREEVEKVQSENANLKKQIAQDEAKADKAASTSNKRLTETVGTIVEQRSGGQFRDLAIRFERLEAELEDEKARNERLEEKLKSRDGKENAKIKKCEGQIAALSSALKRSDEENRELRETKLA